MKLHTNDFKEQIKTLGKEIEVKISYGDTVLGVDNLNAVNLSYQGAILKSVMKQLDVDSNIDIPLGTVFKCEFGLKVNGEYEYINLGNYIVKSSEKQEDTGSYKIVCYDKLLISMHEYSKLPITYPISVRDYINSLCLVFGIKFKNKNEIFANYEKLIKSDLYDGLGYTFRDILDELAQVTASTICINNNDELEVRYINNTFDEIDEEFLRDVNVNFGEKYGPINSVVLSRSGESDNIYLRDENSVNDNGLCEIKIVDNQIMNFNDRDQYLGDILNKLNGLEYYLNDYSSTGIIYYDICDRYGVKVGDNVYSCVMFNDEINITQGIVENVFTEMPEETQTDYTKADKTDRRINQAYIIVDKQNQQIESVVSQTEEQNQKIAKVTQTVDELNSKISDIADITTSQESNDGRVSFDNINASEPIRIVIRPNGEHVSYLYPNSELYPSNKTTPEVIGIVPSENLTPSSSLTPKKSVKAQSIFYPKNRKIIFENTKNNKIVEYEIPEDLYYFNDEVYDEFIMDYDSLSCVVNKNVGIDKYGNAYKLDKTYINEYKYPHIELEDGDYNVKLLGAERAYIFVRLMSQNIYTTQFATKAELNSEISQTVDAINLEVSKKIDIVNEETTSKINQKANEINLEVNKKVGNDEIISKINQSAEQVQINANKISLDGKEINLTSGNIVIKSNNFSVTKEGKITSTSGKIGGFDLGQNSFSANISTTYNFTKADVDKVVSYINGNTKLTDAEIIKYDVDGDGVVDKVDSLLIQRMYYGYASNTINGTLEINSKETIRTLILKDSNGKIKTSVGLSGIQTPSMSVNGVPIQNAISYDSGMSDMKVGYWIDGKPIYRRIVTHTGEIRNGTSFQHFIYNIDQITKFDILFKIGDEYYTKLTTLDTGAVLSAKINKTHITYIGNDYWTDQSGRERIFTIEFTKTTD